MRRAVLLLSLGLACSSKPPPGEGRPVATLSTTPEAARDFVAIREALEDPAERRWPHLRQLVDQFLERHPKDGLAPLARVYLAFCMIEQNDLPHARDVVASLRDLPDGSTRDLWTVAQARLLRLGGEPDKAVDLVRPLVGKMVDATARELLLEEISLDAIDAQRHYEAVGYMDAWLRGVSENDRDRVRARAQKALSQVPPTVLEATYRSMRAQSAAGSGYSLEIQRLVAQRLGEIALEKGDPNLARWLLDPSSGTPIPTGDAGAELGELATSRRGLVSVQGRTIGLLLPTGNTSLRDEAAEVVRGLSWALDLPRADASKGDGVRLVTRSDYGDSPRTDTALEELAGEGAAVVVAGFDPATSERALAWGDRTGMPVIALALPRGDKKPAHGFLLGEQRLRELEVLTAGLTARGIAKAGFVTAAKDPERTQEISTLGAGGALALLPPVGCDVSPPHPGEARFPFAAWGKDGVRAWVVAGASDCTRDAMREAMIGAPRGATVGVVLEGASIAERLATTRILAVAAGVVPVRESTDDPDVKSYVAQLGARPGWWTALGRDAGALARKAIVALPTDTATSVMAVTMRRASLEAGLLAARARLWTSEAEGFDQGRTLKRTLKIEEILPESRSAQPILPKKK